MFKLLYSLLLPIIISYTVFRYSLGDIDVSLFDNPSKLFYVFPCENPIKYKIGSINKNFNLTQDKLISDISTAANIWNEPYGSVIFKYDPSDQNAITINMVYDERQNLNSTINKLENIVNTSEGSLNNSFANYNKRVTEFNKRLLALNQEIKNWNDQRGSSNDDYERLIKEHKELSDEANNLKDLSIKLNQSTTQHNQQVVQLNENVNNFNQILQNNPEEGIFDSAQNKIDIYLVNNQQELVHTLSHELGHARGLNHSVDPKSIMYSFSTETISATKEDISSLKTICNKISISKIFNERISNLSNLLKQRLSPLQ